jgi:hypothetical protein
LLTAEHLATADAEVVRLGTRLLTRVIRRCYRIGQLESGLPAVKFESEHSATRLKAALAFGAVTALVLMPRRPSTQQVDAVELTCAIFNLGIGLLDGLCDEQPEIGLLLLELVRKQDLANAAEVPRHRAWLRRAVPPTLAEHPTIPFAIELIETFFETLHEAYPGADCWQVRRGIGAQLGVALEAEYESVNPLADQRSHERLIKCSWLTSVVPFQIIEQLAGGRLASHEPTAGTHLGEAMWRIDDLVDLCLDARSGALNAVLLGVVNEAKRPAEGDLLTALEQLLVSTAIAEAATEAADKLLAGLQAAPADHRLLEHFLPRTWFLSFTQRYAEIAPRQTL